VFERVVQEYVEREGWSPASMRAFVTDQLRSQLRRAYEEVAYYRETFARGGWLGRRRDRCPL
jgi:phenylacetate-coenzyme A ligase PaaK-like adenylate-forming protein